MAIALYRKDQGSSEATVKRRIVLFPVVLMVSGSVLIGSVAGPIVGYFLITSPRLQRTSALLSPLPAHVSASPNDPLSSENESTALELVDQKVLASEPVVDARLDYRRPENWFPSVE